MSKPISQSCFITTILLVFYFISPIYGFESRKLDELSSSDPSIKCGGCSPCGHPSCYASPPPPPPSLPPPPPPPPKKPPSSPYCPPPPYAAETPPPTGTGGGQGGFVYITAPPGELYPVDPNYSNSGRVFGTVKNTFLGFGFLGLLISI